MKNKLIAIIPAKSHSGRLPNKNFREFAGDMSITEIKINQCLNSGIFNEIYLSTDSDIGIDLTNRYNIKLHKRNPIDCMDSTPWSDVLVHVLSEIPAKDNDLIYWCPPTSPLFSRFGDIRDFILKSDKHDSAMTVTKLKHYYLNPDLIPLNFQFGVWASYSQNLRPIFQMNCACWVAPKGKMIRNRFQTGDNIGFFETSLIEGIDIDTIDEFELSQYYFTKQNQLK